MATKYSVKNILVSREDANGNILVNPIVIQLCLTENSLREEKTYEDLKCLLKEGVTRVEGQSAVNGSWKYKLEAHSLDFTMSSIFGDKQAVADTTANAWLASTVMAIGDQINITDAGVDYTLTVTKLAGAGQTGLTIPTSLTVGKKVVDNEVTWVVSKKLIDINFDFENTAPKFTAEFALVNNADGTIFYKQYRHLELDKLSVTVDGSEVYEVEVDPMGGVAVDSDSADWTTNLLANAGVKLVVAGGTYFGGDCELSQVIWGDGSKELDTINLTINKGITTQKLVNCKTRNDRDLVINGTLNAEFTPEKYESFKCREFFDLEIILETRNGAKVDYFFDKVVPEFKDPLVESKNHIFIDPAINVEQLSLTPIARVLITVPAMTDSLAGDAIIGDGTYSQLVNGN